MSAGGGCEAAVTVTRTRCGWGKHKDCGKLLYGRLPLNIKMAVCMIHARPVILNESETRLTEG